MPDKKYLAVGGHSESGRLLSAMQVAQSHGVDLSDCIFASSEAMVRGMIHTSNKIILRPLAKIQLEVSK